MAEKQTETQDLPTEETPKPKRGLRAPLIALLIVGIMAAEGALGWWALSRSHRASASDARVHNESSEDTESTASTTASTEGEEADLGEQPLKEVEIGAFQLSNRTASGLNMHVQLALSGTVPEALTEEFAERYEQHKSRIRQSVLSIIRSSTQQDLADPSLSLIRRKIQDQLNRLLGKKFLVDVVVTEVSVIGQ